MIAFTAITAMASWGGVWVARGQLAEMESSSKQASDLVQATQNLATAAKGQAEAARNQAVAMDKLRAAGETQALAAQHLADAGAAQAASTASLAENSGRQLGALQASSEAAKIQADAVRKQADATVVASRATDRLAASGKAQADAVLQSLAAAKAANDIALKASLVADRPWLSAGLPGRVVPQPGAYYVVTFDLRNTGRGPALKTRMVTLLDIYKSDVSLPLLTECTAQCQMFAVFPNGGFAYHPTIKGDRLTAEQIKRIQDGLDAIILRTRTDYVDANERAHTTWSCSFYSPTLGGFTSCRRGAEAN